jgi:hypothetical protein
MKVPRMTGRTSAHQNQFPAIPSVATSPAIARGVSAAKVVATIEVPASHQGSVRPATKKASVFFDALRACHAPQPNARIRYATMMLRSRVVSRASLAIGRAG